jgi:putative ABC transport system permease protein
MDGGQSALNSEVWRDLNQISSDYNRQGNLSSILVRASDAINGSGADHGYQR